MRWKCMAWLGAMLSLAGAQVLVDENIHLSDQASRPTSNPTTTQTTTTISNTAAREIINDDIISDDIVDNSEMTKETTEDDDSGGTTDPTGSEENVDPDEEDNNVSDNKSEGDDQSNANEDDGDGNNENGSEETAGADTSRSETSAGQSSRETAAAVIETDDGQVQGFYLHGDSGIRSFIDIPYGRFTGPFQAPTEALPWINIHQVSQHDSRCPQIDENGEYTETTNCLTLSVFAPSDVENAAVLFHIYDGDFNTGSADHSIYGPEYLVPKGIILVLPNYRLGALGFLCMGDDIAPGNAGLKDLTLALKWTKNNIAKFGGDPSKIIVSGDGTAGALAGYLALSPMSRPYVNGVITESGSLLAHWSIDRNPNTTASSLRTAFGDDITNDISSENIVIAAKGINFRPCIETGTNAFMNKSPWEILNDEKEKIDIPFVIGSANYAGILEASAHTTESLTEINNDYTKLLPNDLQFNSGEDSKAAEKIKKQYFGENTLSLEHIDGLALFYTDAYYLGPSIRVSRSLVRAGAKVHFYEFSFVGDLNRMLGSTMSNIQGAARGDLVSYVFTQNRDVPQQGTDEDRMVELITDLWTSFMQTGTPTAEGVLWNSLESVEESKEEWLLIDSDPSLKQGVHVERLALWTELYNQHFIERSSATARTSSACLLLIAIFVLGFTKEL